MAKTIVLILVFCSTFALVQAVYVLLVLTRSDKHPSFGGVPLNPRRYFALEHVLRQRLACGQRRDYLGVRRLVVQSGLDASPLQLALYYSCASIVCMLCVALLTDHSAMQALGGAFAGLIFVYLYYVLARRTRIALFSEQLPDAIEVMVIGLRAGYPVSRSLALVASEMPDPVSYEFAIASDEMSSGSSLQQAMDALFARVGHPALRFLAVALSARASATVSLPGVLTNLASVLRQRYVQSAHAPAFMSQIRYPAMAFAALSLGLLVALSQIPVDFDDFWQDIAAPRTLWLSIFALIAGNYIIYRIFRQAN